MIPNGSTGREHRRRVSAIRARLTQYGADAAVFTPGDDLHYLTGQTLHSHERLTALIVPSGDAPPTLILPRLELTDISRGAADSVEATLSTWVDGDDPVSLLATQLGHVSTVVVSSSCPAAHLIPLISSVEAEVRLAGPVIDHVRAVKSMDEVWQLAEAARRIDEVHARMSEFVQVGRTERQAADDIAAAIVSHGLQRAEFVIVGSGPNGADPHHQVSDRVIEPGDVVVVDIGGPLVSGYHSDCTRTYVMGRATDDIARDYEVLEQAQKRARDAVRPGASFAEVDAAARTHLTDAGLGHYFTHRTGHSIGLGLHEAPFVAPGESTVLREGMVFSVEPGIYLPGQWGARIEDIVAVTADGCMPLNDRPRNLASLPG